MQRKLEPQIAARSTNWACHAGAATGAPARPGAPGGGGTGLAGEHGVDVVHVHQDDDRRANRTRLAMSLAGPAGPPGDGPDDRRTRCVRWRWTSRGRR